MVGEKKLSKKKYISWRQKLISLEKITVSEEQFFLHEGKVMFLQIKQDATRQKCCHEHEKR